MVMGGVFPGFSQPSLGINHGVDKVFASGCVYLAMQSTGCARGYPRVIPAGIYCVDISRPSLDIDHSVDLIFRLGMYVLRYSNSPGDLPEAVMRQAFSLFFPRGEGKMLFLTVC